VTKGAEDERLANKKEDYSKRSVNSIFNGIQSYIDFIYGIEYIVLN
jgi:hypothetical protein